MIRKLRGRTPEELQERLRQAARAWLERAGLSLHSGAPSQGRFVRMLSVGAPSSADALLAELRGKPSAFFPAFDDLAATAATIRRHWPAAAEDTIARADQVRAGHFELLGYSALSFGVPVDWHLDPITGRRAPRRHWTKIPYLDAGSVGDHKVIWELNRQQYLICLGQAYQLTGEERYAESVASHLAEWMDANPPKQGINWASSLEVAFRAIAWIWALRLIARSPALTPALYRRVLGILHVHATHLESYLSTYFSPNTHLTGEGLGLVYLGTQLDCFRAAPRWLETGAGILVAERARQIRPDGTYFEQATYYHRYTADFYLHLLLLARAHGHPSAEAAQQVLPGLLDFLLAITRPDGSSPRVGDDDGGRLVPLASRPADDFRDTLALGGAVLHRPDYCLAAGPAPVELAWLLGADAAAQYEAVGRTQPAASWAFPDGGYYVMRDGWGADASSLLVECGPHGGLSGGHAHADALAIEIVAAGTPMLTDPGTYAYTSSPAWRDRLRHSAVHSTVSIDGESSAVPAGPFRWRFRAEGRDARWVSSRRFDYFSGAHDGYQRLDPPATHRRSVLFIKRRLFAIRDRIDSAADRGFSAHFHGAPNVTVERLDTHEAVWRAPDGRGLFLSVSAPGDLTTAVESASETYGALRDVETCTCQVAPGSGNALVTLLIPLRSGDPSPSVEWGIGWARVRGETGFDEVWYDGTATASGERATSDAEWLWIHRRVDGVADEFVLLNGTTLDIDGSTILQPGGAAACVSGRRDSSGWRTDVHDERVN